MSILQSYAPLTESAQRIEQRKAKLGGTREFKRTLMNQQPTFNYMKGLARSEKKRGEIKEKYYKAQTKIRGDAQIAEMFDKLDADGSGGIDMDEMTDLFIENGLHMSKEDIAEMFSIVTKINKGNMSKEVTQSKKNGHVGVISKDLKEQTIEEKLKLVLSRSDFSMVTENPEALRCKQLLSRLALSFSQK